MKLTLPRLREIIKEDIERQMADRQDEMIQEVISILEQAIPKAEQIYQSQSSRDTTSALARQVGSLQGSIKMALGYLKG